ncbi:PAS and ANTAR domain-containing protein [Promicromonospora sp. NPDC019610]|uniref:PAS and ANTAR domain-containing protein n=1 Tax=Promicromonospora sp. NPDC019610 TaxID=3364405 RepID=UPI00379404E4
MEGKIEEVLDGGDMPPVGRYLLDLVTEKWSWSDEVYKMHGFEPGEVVPTTGLMLSHKHPDDLGQTDGVLKQAAESGETFSSVHRIIDAKGATRVLVITGQGRRDASTGQVAELYGYFIDVTGSHRAAAAREATLSIKASAERRAVIDQARGMLMMVYSVDHDMAFQLLRRVSNDTNVPVRDIADAMVEFVSSSVPATAENRARVDEFLRSFSPS